MRPCKYPWRTIEIGESFFAPGRTSRSIGYDARRYYAPRRFTCRKIMIKGVVGVKVTRIE